MPFKRIWLWCFIYGREKINKKKKFLQIVLKEENFTMYRKPEKAVCIEPHKNDCYVLEDLPS